VPIDSSPYVGSRSESGLSGSRQSATSTSVVVLSRRVASKDERKVHKTITWERHRISTKDDIDSSIALLATHKPSQVIRWA